MIEQFLLIALPYLALFVCIFGSIYRIRKESLTYSALSSQFLENKALLWGSVPWHVGIIVILLGHMFALFIPGFWQWLLSYKYVLIAGECLGLALTICCLAGLIVLLIRRLTSARIQVVTTNMDLIVLGLLLVQVVTGAGIALHYRWGASWSTGTLAPYIHSIIFFSPNISYVEDLPLLVKVHIVGAWVLILLIPFSRLIHMFAVPIQYLFRPPQVIVWNNPRRNEIAAEHHVREEARRYFLKGSASLAAGVVLLSIGALDKIFRFFFGPRLSSKEEGELMELRLKRLQATVHQRQLELERQQTNYILIGALSELSSSRGKYFIDYQMCPALAFVGNDGLPILISAKCTHLGCTVGNEVNNQGKILCPCHVSFFDIKTGMPNPGSPAKEPLPHIPWVLMDKKGQVIASCNAQGHISGNTGAQTIAGTNVYIRKNEGTIS